MHTQQTLGLQHVGAHRLVGPAPLPFLRLVNDVTNLHVEGPVLALQGSIGSFLWGKEKQDKAKNGPGLPLTIAQ